MHTDAHGPLLPPAPLQYKPAPPLSIPSAAYTSALAETFRLGRSDSADRTQEQTDTAKFWADGNSELFFCSFFFCFCIGGLRRLRH